MVFYLLTAPTMGVLGSNLPEYEPDPIIGPFVPQVSVQLRELLSKELQN